MRTLQPLLKTITFLSLFLGGFLFAFASPEVDFEVTVTGVECFDGVDNDSDGFVDYPNDPDCESTADTQEASDEAPVVVEEEESGSTITSSGSNPNTPPQDEVELAEDGFSEEEGGEISIIDEIRDLLRPILIGVSEIQNPPTTNTQGSQVQNITSKPPEEKRRNIVRFTLPAVSQTFSPEQVVNEPLVFEGPVQITFFDVSNTLKIISQDGSQTSTNQLPIMLASVIGVLIAFRFFVHTNTERGMEEEVYHPHHNKVLVSLTSIVLICALGFSLYSAYSPYANYASFGDTALVVTTITTNNIAEDHELLVEYKDTEESFSKHIVTIKKGFGSVEKIFAIEEKTPQVKEIQTRIAGDAFNSFVGVSTVSVSRFSQRDRVLISSIVALLALLVELGSMVWYRRFYRRSVSIW